MNLQKIIFPLPISRYLFFSFNPEYLSDKSAIIIDSINEVRIQNSVKICYLAMDTHVKYVSGENVTVEFFKNLQRNTIYTFLEFTAPASIIVHGYSLEKNIDPNHIPSFN